MMNDLPFDFTERMKKQLGDEYDAFIGSYDDLPTRAFRLSRQKIDPADRKRFARIASCSENPEEVPFADGAYYYDVHARPGSSPLHDAGAYYIQEPSAMIPVSLLDITNTGQKVLDLCAAPGGKTTQIADLMEGVGLLVANEPVEKRARILSENTERMGVKNALVVSHDPSYLADRFPSFFDRILVDAPCSGEGMFRKNPEAVNEWSLENVKMCARRQQDILNHAATMLAPGGRIVYSTCTFSYDEDEGLAERFLASHPEFEICDKPVKIYPHMHRCEGHFAVSFCRKEDSLSVPDHRKNKIGRPVLSHIENTLLCDFLDACLTDECAVKRAVYSTPERILRFGDSIYLAPEYLPDISGLVVYRTGLKLGTFKKNRFEPDHALSHVLNVRDVLSCVDLEADDPRSAQYISGMTISCPPGIKGWCLVSICGLGLGWGKADRGIVKNHYPRGLRNV